MTPTKMISALLVFGLSAAFAAPAFAQDALPVRISSAAADLPPGATTSTAVFRAEALRSDAVDRAASRLALARSKDPQILDHARRVLANRKATTDALLPPGAVPEGGIATRFDGSADHARASVALGPAERAAIERLRASPDETSFNRAYAAQQARSDERTLALYDGFTRNGDTAQGRRFAYEALPWIESERARSAALNELYGG